MHSFSRTASQLFDAGCHDERSEKEVKKTTAGKIKWKKKSLNEKIKKKEKGKRKFKKKRNKIKM